MMADTLPAAILPKKMSDGTFAKFSNFVHGELGIKLPPAKKNHVAIPVA